MRNSITDKLKTSLESERKSVKSKVINHLDNRFTKADNVFTKHIKNEIEKNNVVRDTFTFPEKDYELIALCKTKLLEKRFTLLMLLNPLTVKFAKLLKIKECFQMTNRFRK